jgi:probable F420-dependent oxidoreductase
MSVKKFRFALQLSSVKDVNSLSFWANKAQDLGFDCISLPDHLGDQLSPISALTYLGLVNKELKVSTLVLDNDFRHPLILAREMATLIELIGPRLELGIGAGWMKSDYETSGISYDPASVRVKRFKEAVLIIKEFFNSKEVNFEGEFYKIRNCNPFPRVSTAPKILIGGGSKNILSFGAKVADILNVNANLSAGYIGPEVIAQMMPDKFDERFEYIKQAAPERLEAIEFQSLIFIGVIGKDAKDKVENLASSFGVDPKLVNDIPAVIAGEPQEIADRLFERRQRWGYSYYVVHEDIAEQFSKVIELLKGK